MMFFKKQKKLSVGWLVLGMAVMTGCTKASEDGDSGTVQFAGQLNTEEGASSKALAFATVSAQAASVYEVYCVTFTQPAVSASSRVDNAGNFSVQMPANTNFGCFVNEVASGQSVATISISGSSTGLGSTASTSLSLAGSINVGAIHLDLDKGEAVIPKEAVAPALAPVRESALKLEDLHDNVYQMSCIKTGNVKNDQKCEEEMTSDDSNNGLIYLRVINAKRDGKPIQGLGVWESKTAFNNCGGIDLTDAKVADIAEKDGITFEQDGLITGTAFTVDEILCPLRDPNGDEEHENIRKYYTLAEVIRDGNGYTLFSDDHSNQNYSCWEEHTTVVHFSGKTANKMIGQFYSKSVYHEQTPGACYWAEGKIKESNYVVEFNKVP